MLQDADDHLVGRDTQMAELRAALADGARAIVLAGAFGVGKTRLAVEIADKWDEGIVVTCSLTDVSDADQLDLALSRAVEADVAGAFERGALLRWLQRSPGSLVVLDSAEGAADAVAELLDEAGRSAPNVRWLVTSRRDFVEAGDDRRTIRLEPMEIDDAVELLVARLPRGFDASAAQAQSELMREVVDKLDRLPLAIELAAARCRVLSLEQLAERLERQRLEMLQGPAPDRGHDRSSDRSKHGSVRQALLLSYDMLDPACRQALWRWSVFRGGFTLEAAEYVTSNSVDVIEELEAHSLLYRTATAGAAPPRFAMLDSIRDFAAEVAPDEQLQRARRLHAEYFAQMAWEAFDEPGRTDPRNFTPMLAETNNFEALFEYAFAARDSELVYVALRALTHIISRHKGPTKKLIGLFDQSEQADLFDGRPELAAYVFYERANIALDADDLDAAIDYFGRAVPPAGEAGLAAVQVRSERGRGVAHLLSGGFDEAEGHFLAGLELARRADLGFQEVFVRCGLCNLGWYRGEFEEALEHAEAALRLIEQEDEPPIEALATVHNTVGASLGMLGLSTRARFHIDRAVEYYSAAHHRVSALTARFNRAILALYSGECDEARRRLIELVEEAGGFLQDHVTTQSYFNLTLLELEAENLDAAKEYLESCRRLAGPDDYTRAVELVVTLDCVEAVYLAARGSFDEARRGLMRLEEGRKDAPAPLVSLLELVEALVEVYERLDGDEVESGGLVDIPNAEKYLIDAGPEVGEPPGYDWVLRRILTDKVQQLAERSAGKRDGPLLRVSPEARQVEWDGEVIDLSRRGPMRRILVTLLDAAGAGPVDVHELLEAGWPDQKIELESGLSRVYTTLRRLRDLGLRDVVLTVDDGYCIQPSIRIEQIT